MADSTEQVLLAYAVAVAGAYVAYRWLRRPLLWLLALAWRCLVGGAAVWALNRIGGGFGLHVALNPVTALVTGVLGVPGLVALVALSA